MPNHTDSVVRMNVHSVEAVCYQISAIYDALITLAIETGKKNYLQVSHGASTLAQQLKDFSFIVSFVVWYKILFQIHVVSKSLQSIINLSKCTEL